MSPLIGYESKDTMSNLLESSRLQYKLPLLSVYPSDGDPSSRLFTRESVSPKSQGVSFQPTNCPVSHSSIRPSDLTRHKITEAVPRGHLQEHAVIRLTQVHFCVGPPCHMTTAFLTSPRCLPLSTAQRLHYVCSGVGGGSRVPTSAHSTVPSTSHNY